MWTSIRQLARAAAIAVVVLPLSTFAQTPDQKLAWSMNAAHPEDFDFARDTTIARRGRVSMRIHADDEPRSFASLSTSLSAAPYRGQRIRFSAFLRGRSLTGGALWARVDDANRRPVGFISTQQTSPFRGSGGWTQVTISLDIPDAAERLVFGVLSFGAGTLWIDDARLESGGDAPPRESGFEDPTDVRLPAPVARGPMAREAPRSLSAMGLANVTAFTRVLGYVRFFHPSAQAVRVNWDAFAVRGIRAVEKAPTPDSLASTLRALFAPIAPTVTFARSGNSLPTTLPNPANATHTLFWRHLGVGAPSGGEARSGQSVYSSERVAVSLDEVGKPLDLGSMAAFAVVARPIVPDPSHPLIVALEGDVTASIPIALFATSGVVPADERAPQPAAETERFITNDRATRLAAVALAWSLFEHFYPYFAVVRTDWPAARDAALRAAATDRDAAEFQRTLQRLVAALHDGHGSVYRSAQMLAIPDIQLGWATERIFVTAVGDSAAATGVKRGDELLAVDGRRADSLLAESSTLWSGATPQWIRSRALSSLLVGDPGSQAVLRLRGSDGATRESRVTRGGGVVKEPPVAKVDDVAPGVVYVDLGRITDADFRTALPRLERAQGIIFDMRGYPRQVNTAIILAHLTDTVIHSAHFEVPVITQPDRKNVGYLDGAWTLQPGSPRLKARIVFLSGGGAISYAESTLGVVEAYHLADIVGEPSAGTNGNVNPFMLPGGYNVVWTGMLVQKRDGTPHHGVGVIPTVRVSPTPAGLQAGRDEVLERAIAVASSRPQVP